MNSHKQLKNIFQKETVEELLQRINSLSPASPRQWGKMSADQMLAHCAVAIEVAAGQKETKRSLLGWTIGPLLKFLYLNEKPLAHNSPTDPSFVITDSRNFETERERLKKLIIQFHEGGPEKVTKRAHAFFGHLEPWQWARGMYKHLDHHLRQFGA